MDYQYKLKLNEMIKKVDNKKVFYNIYNIVYNDIPDKITVNDSGVYFNINHLSNTAINQLKELLNTNTSETETKINLNQYSVENKVENIQGQNNGPRLSSQEKLLVNKYN
jgi:hypothetical protein